MTVEYLKEYAHAKMKQFPSLKEVIEDFLQLALDNIEEGESVENEVALSVENIKQECIFYLEGEEKN